MTSPDPDAPLGDSDRIFTPDDRDRLLAALVARAREDSAVAAAALVGSVARGEADRWSDIDLALRVAEGVDLDGVAADWTAWVAATVPVADWLDVWAGPTRYRVFLTDGSMQVDLSFWHWEHFAATSPSFRPIFGEAGLTAPRPVPERHELVGLAWLYALHVRSSIRRGRHWQADHMFGQMRDHLIELACLRVGLPHREGRGADQLPAAWLARLALTRTADLSVAGQAAALSVAIGLLAEVAAEVDPDLAARIARPLRLIASTGRDVALDPT